MMQFFTCLILAAATVQAHYTFPRLVVNGKEADTKDWLVTRETKNAQSKSGVTSVSSPDIRCYQATTAAQIAEVPAGATIHYESSQQVNHPGPWLFYLAKVPAGQSASTWDGSGSVWFKFYESLPTMGTNKQLSWPGNNLYISVNATIPLATPPGEYLLRVEQIALHLANQAGGAQFYLACSQVTITGSGAGTPGPLVAFPGAYKTADPGILVNINNLATASAYVPPGPAVWTG